MAGKSGGGAAPLQPCEEQALRGHIESAAAGKTNLTDEQLVDLLCSAFPQSYSRTNRKLLAGRVAKITPLPCRRGDAIDEPTPATNKRQKTTPVTKGGTKIDGRMLSMILNKPIPANFAEDSSDSSGNSYESDDLSDRRDVDGINREISADLGGRGELGGRRERNKNGNNVNRNNWPTFGDSWETLVMELIVPLHQSKLLRHLGIESIPRILLHGPPGCGKTTFARAIANEAGVPLFEISAAELVSRVFGAPQQSIRELFSTACLRAPAIVFIDDIDAMTSKMESLQKEIEPHMVNQLIACMDEPYKLIKPVNHDADSESSNRSGYVMVIGATNTLDALDPALKRRFDRKIFMGDLFGHYRYHILSSLTRNLKVEDGSDIVKLGRCTLGFVARDLAALVQKASMLAVNRIMHKRTSEAKSYMDQRYEVQYKDCYKQPFHDKELENVSITMADFVKAVKWVQPSSEIELLSTTPKAKWKWDDVGGLELVKLTFERHIVQRIKFPEVYEDLGSYWRTMDIHGPHCRRKTLITRFLLHGPSGCGKTLIVQALANEAGAKFIHVKAGLLTSFDGGSGELVVQILFSYARTCSPCILFFDELERIACGRESPVINQLLKELVDVQYQSGVYVIATTNRDDIRERVRNYVDEVLTIHPPTPVERGSILKALARTKPVDASVDLMALGKDVACENSSGADLYALMIEAASIAIDRPPSPGESCRVPWTIKDEDLKTALKRILPFARAR